MSRSKRVSDDELAASFALVPFTREQLHAALRDLGPSFLKSRDMRESYDESNPTRNTCYVVSECVYWFCAPEGTQAMQLDVPGDNYKHRYLVWPGGERCDLTCDQFSDFSRIDYTKAKRRAFLQTGGRGPSQRARQLAAKLHIDGSKPAKQRKAKIKGPKLPAPVIEQYGALFVVRDDLIGIGSKARFVGSLIDDPSADCFAYACPATGWAQVSLPAVCAHFGKTVHLFAARRERPNVLQQKAIDLGAVFHWIDNGMLSVTEARARAFAEETPRCRLLPMGLNVPIVVEQIALVARRLPITPTEIWSVGSSCTLSRGLQLAWPDAPAHVVAVGHTPSADELGRAKLWRYPGPFDRACRKADMPPYPSVATYDAKVWTFAHAYAKAGALIWNVAADIDK